MSTARVTAFLGMDISAFRSGLDQASGKVQGFKRLLTIGGIGGALKQALGAGAIIQSFREILNNAQEARDKARELGQALDPYTASVAAYADQWDRIKSSIASAAISGLGFFTSIGNKLGQAMGTASSPEEIEALDAAQRQQAKTDIELKNNALRLERELGAAQKENDESYQRALESRMNATEKFHAILKDIADESERFRDLSPGSIEGLRSATRINNLNARLPAARSAAIAENTSERGGLSLAEIASASPVGRRSERERLAAQSMRLSGRADRAEAQGNFGFAANLRSQATALEAKVSPGGGKVTDIKWVPGEDLLEKISTKLTVTTVNN